MGQATSLLSLRRRTTLNPIHAKIQESREKKYDVFLNFRGNDTRRNIADHLYLSLKDAGICVYMDEPSLPFGENIERKLHAAIEQSRIAITIISEDYASSDNCLKELVHILKCKDTGILTVMPIFYKVKPCDIRSLRNSFKRIQSHIVKSDGTIVESWKGALKRIANMKGLVVDDTSHEGMMVRSIVEKVKLKLKNTPKMNGNKTSEKKIYMDHLVGIDEKASEIMEAVSENTNVVDILGIYGESGIGKTTLARYIYNQLKHSFEFCSFVVDIGATLQWKASVEQLISIILKSGASTGNSCIEGMNRIKKFCHDKNVLVVLDDIDGKIRMRTLMRMCKYFGPGSKIILTSRWDVFIAPEVTLKYELSALNPAQSMELFCKKAFGRPNPPYAFKDISKRVVEFSGGLPLAIELIGSALSNKTKEEWKSTLKELQDSPHKDVKKILLLVFQALDKSQKLLFLGIALFPNGLDMHNLSPLLEATQEKALYELQEMSLVKIDYDHKLHMHDSLRELAREILQVEGGEESRSNCWLWVNVVRRLMKRRSKEVFKSTSSTEEIAATFTTQVEERGYFLEVQFNKKGRKGAGKSAFGA